MYRIRLISDEEMLSKSESVYTIHHLISKNHTLDSARFGATVINNLCDICGQRLESCIGHYAVIQLPFPIPRLICLKDFKILITLICPICSHLLTPNIKDALKQPVELRFDWVRNEVNKFTKNGELNVVCPTCNNRVTTITVMQNEPSLRICIHRNQINVLDQINPVQLYNILQNFSELDEIGFSENYHPKNFMTNLIPIIPNKLRPKTQNTNESALTSYYRVIIEEICPELSKIYKLSQYNNITIGKDEILNNFNKYYDKLLAYYLLITDISSEKSKTEQLSLIDKRDSKHSDQYISLLGRLKGKEKSIFSKGIIDTRINISARVVLGGATESPIKNLNIPYHVASKLTMLYPVYKQNINAMKQLICAQSNTDLINNIYIPHALYICNTQGKISKITIKDAQNRASLLRPGDKVAITLFNNDIIMQSRFPIVREECWGSFMTKKDNNSIITIPLSCCKREMADFDGDENQIYMMSSHYTDVESLLLHSMYAQYIGHKDGNPAIWYSADAPYGIDLMKQNNKSNVYNYKLVTPAIDVISVIESYLPKNFSYVDSKTEIVNSKFKNNKTKIDNEEMHKYIAYLYGNDVAEEFMDKIIQLAYDLNINFGNTLGNEIRIYGSKVREQIRAIINETYEKMKITEQSNDEHKDVLQIVATEEHKAKIKELLIESSKGQNIYNNGFSNKFQEEYYQMVAMIDHVIIDNKRIQPDLAEGSRVNCAFPRYSIDPCAYGLTLYGYRDDISPISHFYECKQQRYALFQKGQGTAKQGYMSKRLAVAFGNNYTDFNGAVINNERIISLVYGNSGLNPRLYVLQPLIDILTDRKEFIKTYKDDRIVELYDTIHTYNTKYITLTCFIKSKVDFSKFIAGVNYEQYIDNYNYKETIKYDKKIIDKFIEEINNIYSPVKCNNKEILENLVHQEYYFRVKFYNKNISTDLLKELLDLFRFTLCDGGEPVGMKASLSTTEPLTQASLHAIHSGGGGVTEESINRSVELMRFEELMSGLQCKNTVIRLKLYNDDYDSTFNFANEQETFYIKDIWTRIELNLSTHIDERIINLHDDIDLKNLKVNNYFITSVWNLTNIAAYNIHVVDVIDKLINNYQEIMFISGYVVSSSEFLAYIYIKPMINVNRINEIIEEWSTDKNNCVIHGKYLKNCFVTENKNNPGHYFIEANEISDKAMALENLIFDERVDPSGCKSTDPVVNKSVFGLCEASVRHYEDLIYTAKNMSVTKGVLYRHYKLITDVIYVNGYQIYATRNSLRHDHTYDPFRLIQFETAKEMIQENLKYKDKQRIVDPVAGAVFGELPEIGTGISKITFYAK